MWSPRPDWTFLRRSLPRLKRERGVHFTVVNGENAAGIGLFPNQAEDILDSGADVVTLGNHTWSKLQIADYLDAAPCVLRPANFAPRLPGRGYGVFDGPHGLRIGVLNLIGRVELNPNVDSPFTTADRILERPEADIVLVDFHAEATSEKLALGWYLDGRVSALWGTHTHVPTADPKVLPRGHRPYHRPGDDRPGGVHPGHPALSSPSTCFWAACPGAMRRRRAGASWRPPCLPLIPKPSGAPG